MIHLDLPCYSIHLYLDLDTLQRPVTCVFTSYFELELAVFTYETMQCHLCICMYTTGFLEGPKRSKWDFFSFETTILVCESSEYATHQCIEFRRHKEVKTGLELNGTVILEVSERPEWVAVKIIKF